MKTKVGKWWGLWVRRATLLVVGIVVISGCARLPYTTQVLHENQRIRITAQREPEPAGYTPVQISPADIAAILRGFSIREPQRLPLRWFAEEAPPRALFRADEILVLAPALAEALAKVGPNERVHFELIAPGMNQATLKDMMAGWVAVRDPYFYLMPEFFHTQVPTQLSDPYYPNDPSIPPLAKNYLLYFEPGRFWVMGEKDHRALDYRQFLKTSPTTGR